MPPTTPTPTIDTARLPGARASPMYSMMKRPSGSASSVNSPKPFAPARRCAPRRAAGVTHAAHACQAGRRWQQRLCKRGRTLADGVEQWRGQRHEHTGLYLQGAAARACRAPTEHSAVLPQAASAAPFESAGALHAPSPSAHTAAARTAGCCTARRTGRSPARARHCLSDPAACLTEVHSRELASPAQPLLAPASQHRLPPAQQAASLAQLRYALPVVPRA